MRAHGMVYFLFNAHQNVNYCIPEGHSSATLFTRPFLPLCVGGAGHETSLEQCCVRAASVWMYTTRNEI